MERELTGTEYRISIHAPAKGATRATKTADDPQCNFNPRSREGSDTKKQNENDFLGISIHAPAKGATVERLKTALADLNFNPRSREGSDDTGD